MGSTSALAAISRHECIERRIGAPGPLSRFRCPLHPRPQGNGRVFQSSPAWVPSQRGAFPVRLHWQRISVCDASAMNSSGVNSVSAWEPSQNGWFWDLPQRHHQYVFPFSSSTTAGRRAAMIASLIRDPRLIRESTLRADGTASNSVATTADVVEGPTDDRRRHASPQETGHFRASGSRNPLRAGQLPGPPSSRGRRVERLLAA